ncbi:MAG: hypothetical protein ACJAWV_001316 [Flammeovirgaceae bacterium]|jgi:hypothetical protein
MKKRKEEGGKRKEERAWITGFILSLASKRVAY